jgi:hypothetical protein
MDSSSDEEEVVLLCVILFLVAFCLYLFWKHGAEMEQLPSDLADERQTVQESIAAAQNRIMENDQILANAQIVISELQLEGQKLKDNIAERQRRIISMEVINDQTQKDILEELSVRTRFIEEHGRRIQQLQAKTEIEQRNAAILIKMLSKLNAELREQVMKESDKTTLLENQKVILVSRFSELHFLLRGDVSLVDSHCKEEHHEDVDTGEKSTCVDGTEADENVENTRWIIVCGLSLNRDDEEEKDIVRHLQAAFGKIEAARTPAQKRGKTEKRTFIFVLFKKTQSLEAALAAKTLEYNGSPLTLLLSSKEEVY